MGVICYVISNDQNYFHVYDDCKKYHAKTCKDEQFCPKSKYPKGRCEPTEIHELVVIEDIILYIFTAEYFIRILLGNINANNNTNANANPNYTINQYHSCRLE